MFAPQASADGTGGPSLFPDDLSQIAGSNFELQNGHLFTLDYADRNFFRDVDKSFSDVFDQLFHSPRLHLFIVNESHVLTARFRPGSG